MGDLFVLYHCELSEDIWGHLLRDSPDTCFAMHIYADLAHVFCILFLFVGYIYHHTKVLNMDAFFLTWYVLSVVDIHRHVLYFIFIEADYVPWYPLSIELPYVGL